MQVEDWEGIARDIHEQTGSILPVDAFALAAACGLAVRPWYRANGALELGEGVIRYPIRARIVRQHGVVAHELGHWALFDAGEDHLDEDAARYLAGALMLPRAIFLRDLHETDWDLDALRARHPNASAEMAIVRMTQLSDATAWVWDDGTVRRRYGSADDDEGIEALVDRVLASEAPQRDGAIRAWPLLEPGFRRVVVVRSAA